MTSGARAPAVPADAPAVPADPGAPAVSADASGPACRCMLARAVRAARAVNNWLPSMNTAAGVPVTTATAALPSRNCVRAHDAPSAGSRCTTSKGARKTVARAWGPATTVEIVDTSKLAA